MPDRYTPSISVLGGGSATVEDNVKASGTIQHNTTTTDAVEVAYTNTYDKNIAQLSVSKTVTGSMGDRAKLFNFEIELTDENDQPLTGSYSCNTTTSSGASVETEDLTLNNGKGTFKLTHDQTITISKLPAGTKFKITETNAQADGYTTTVTSSTTNNSTVPYEASGELSGQTAVTVNFENTKDDVPATGISLDYWPWALLAVFVVTAAAALTYSAKRPGGLLRVKGGKHVGK